MPITTRLRLQTLEAREVPAADLAYALALTGLPATAVTHAVADPAGNLYVTGTFSGTVDLNPDPIAQALAVATGGTEVFVAKYGNAGQLVWARTLEGQADESAADVAIDGIGNVYVAGTFTGAVDFNPDAAATAVFTAANGGSAFLWKLDPNGAIAFARTVDGPSSAAGLAVDQAGNVVVAGTFTGAVDFNPDPNNAAVLSAGNPMGGGFLWKIDQPGNLVWARGFQTSGAMEVAGVALDGQGYAYLAGRFTGTADLDPSDAGRAPVAGGSAWTPFVVKVGGQGDYQWGKALRPLNPAPSATNTINGLAVDGIGNVYAAGTFTGGVDFDPNGGTTTLTATGTTTDGYVWKLDPQGNLAYARKFGGPNAETVGDLSVDKAGNAYVTGTFTGVGDFDPGAGVINLGGGTGAADGFVLKLGPQGGLAYTRSLGGGASTTRPTTIFADGAGNMYLSGAFTGRADFNPGVGTVILPGGVGSGFLVRIFPAVGATPGPADLPPKNVSAGGPYTIFEGDGLKVKGSGVDPEGKKLTYSWDLNGDGLFGDYQGANLTLTAADLAKIGLSDGTGTPRTVKVRIGDGINVSVEASTTLTIQNLAPTGGKIKYAGKLVEGVRPELWVGGGITDRSAADVKAGFRASWDFNDDGKWDLGDGSSYAGSVIGTVKVPRSFVADSGPLAVRVRVFDKDGGYAELTTTLVIAEGPPSAQVGLVGTARAGQPSTFQFTQPLDGPADTAAGFTYSFDFDNNGTWDAVGRNPQATVTFPFRGTFPVKAMITDADGMSTTYTLTVNAL